MKVTFLHFIFLVILIFACEISEASWFIDGDNYNSSVHAQLSCLECHSNIIKDPDHPSVEDTGSSPDDFINNGQCIDCHEQALESFEPVEPGNLKKAEKAGSDACASCHPRHHEKIAHDTHHGVPCVSCHLANVKPLRVMDGTRRIWGYDVDINEEYDPHPMISEKDDICLRCHFEGNNLGASDHAPPR